MIEDALPLPLPLLLRSRFCLSQLCAGQQLSAGEIAAMTSVSHSVVLPALDRHGIPRNGNGSNGHKCKAQIPCRFEVRDGRLVRHQPDQTVILLIRQHPASGLSLRAIAAALNERLVPTRNCGLQ